MKERPGKLYRHFGTDGALLYVGVSLSAINRLREHRQQSAWFDDIVRVDIETFPSLKEAFAAERQAIQTEQPRYNIIA
jgi:excinuclease UvrABC nuclease subunit